MNNTAGILPVKTRLPMMMWIIAGLMTIFSLVTSLIASAAAPELSVSAADQVMPAKAIHQPNAFWVEPSG